MVWVTVWVTVAAAPTVLVTVDVMVLDTVTVAAAAGLIFNTSMIWSASSFTLLYFSLAKVVHSPMSFSRNSGSDSNLDPKVAAQLSDIGTAPKVLKAFS